MKPLAPSGLGAKTMEPEPRLVSGSPSLPQGWQLKCWAPYDGDLSSPAHRTVSSVILVAFPATLQGLEP